MPTLAKEEDAPNDASELDEPTSSSPGAGISRAAKPKPSSGGGGAASAPSAE